MKKKIINVLLCNMLVLLLSSCNNIFNIQLKNSTADKEVSFVFRANEELIGNDLTVCVQTAKNRIVKSAKITDVNKPCVFDFENVPVGKECSIFATIENADKIFYEGKKRLIVKTGENPVDLNLKPFYGYLLWNNATPNSNKDNCAWLTKSKPTKTETVGSNPKWQHDPTSSITDFCFNSTGVPYVVFNSNVIYKNGKSITISGTTINLVCGIYKYGDDLIVLGENNSKNVAVFKISEESVDAFTTTELTKSSGDALTASSTFSDIASYKNNIFFAEFYSTSGAGFKLHKGIVNDSDNTYEHISVIDSSSLGLKGYAITDLQVVDNYLYALVLDVVSNSEQASRGGVLKIDPNSFSVVSKMGISNKTVLDTKVEAENYFIGPRHFIAERPGKLVIAENGRIRDDTKISLSRITTVDLSSDKIESVLYLDNLMFDGGIEKAQGNALYKPIYY